MEFTLVSDKVHFFRLRRMTICVTAIQACFILIIQSPVTWLKTAASRARIWRSGSGSAWS